MIDTSSQPGPDSLKQGNPYVLLVVCSALFFGVVNGSAVAVVLPEIGVDLRISAGNLSWILSSFLLTYGVAIPFYGRIASRFGARRLFLIGVAVFALGSGLSAIASGFEALLVARIVQALGGAAVPGLGMTLVSRAYPEERRGFALGVVSATMGIAAAAGPLIAGVISLFGGWRYLFAVSALAILSVAMGIRFLQRNETLTREPLDLIGGALLGTVGAGFLYFITTGSQNGWLESRVLASVAVALVALVFFGLRQRRMAHPFIPRSLLANRAYLLLTGLGFAITFANLAVQIGLPFLFDAVHGMSTLSIGIALVPAALTTAAVGVITGRMTDRIGATTPIRIGSSLMLGASLAFSTWVGNSSVIVAALAIVFAAGFALVNTPLPAAVSLLVKPPDLASALSITTMMFFIGGSFGTALFSSVVVNTDSEAFNPFHHHLGAGFSNAFLAVSIPIVIGLALAPRRAPHFNTNHQGILIK